MRRALSLWIAVTASAGCGSTPSRPAAARTADPVPLASVPIDPQAPRRPLDRFADRLDELAVDELSLAAGDSESPCRGVAPPFVVLSALSDGGEGVSCLVGASAARCVNFVDHEPHLAEQALCGESAEEVEVPRRARAIAASASAGWRVTPIPAPTGFRALGLRTGDDYYLLVRRGSRWIASPRPVAGTDGHEVGPERLLDSRSLTEDPSFALVASSYRGGSQQGEVTTRILILSEDLAERAVRDIGILVWTIEPDERAEHPDGASSLRSRPHLEVLLEPSITADGLLRLELLREHRPDPDRRRFQRDPCKPRGDGDLLDLACPVSRIDLIERDAGYWRFEDAGGLVRDRR